MDLFEFVSKHFWVMFIIVIFVNAMRIKIRAKKEIERDPSLKSGYDTIFKGLILWGNIPWIIMGAGILTGSLPNIWHYFRPQDGNIYVIAFFISIFIIWLLGTYWIFKKKGAEMLVKHPGLFTIDFASPTMVKFLWVISLVGGIACVIMMFTMNTSIPNIR